MTLAVLVLAPESTGNHLMTNLLMAAGCMGDATAHQRLDDGIPPAHQPIVWMRSFPHGGRWVDIPEMADALRLQGYTVKAVTLFRDWHIQQLSQVAAGHVVDEAHARVRIREAYVRIFTGIAQAGLTHDYVPVVYSALVAHPVEVLTDVLGELGLDVSPERVREIAAQVFDANAKYYASGEVVEECAS